MAAEPEPGVPQGEGRAVRGGVPACLVAREGGAETLAPGVVGDELALELLGHQRGARAALADEAGAAIGQRFKRRDADGGGVALGDDVLPLELEEENPAHQLAARRRAVMRWP